MLARSLLTRVGSSMPGDYCVIKKWLDLITKYITVHFPSVSLPFGTISTIRVSDFCAHRRAEGRACGVVQLAWMKIEMAGAMWQSRR